MSSLDIVDFADIKAYMGWTASTATSYPNLQPIKDICFASIEEFLGRELLLTTRTASFSSSPVPENVFSVVGIPVTASTVTITVDGDALTTDQYYVKPYGFYLNSAVTDSPVEISYTGGAATTASGLHHQISKAALMQLAHEFNRSKNPGASNVSNEGGSISYPDVDLLVKVEKMLRAHMHPLKAAGI